MTEESIQYHLKFILTPLGEKFYDFFKKEQSYDDDILFSVIHGSNSGGVFSYRGECTEYGIFFHILGKNRHLQPLFPKELTDAFIETLTLEEKELLDIYLKNAPIYHTNQSL